MATVITNLLSAVPVFGQDLVELIYYLNVENYSHFQMSLIKADSIFIIGVENDSFFILQLNILPTIGVVSKQALKKGKTLRVSKEEYLSIPVQFIAFFTGLIDGDGYIQITKTTKGFIAMKLTLIWHISDLSTLEYIHSVLKLGKITVSRDKLKPICKLIINKTDLQEVLFPLLKYHHIFFLTNSRREQFKLAMLILEKDIKTFDSLSSKTCNHYHCLIQHSQEEIINNKLSDSSAGYLRLPFFKNWLVGFTNAEGSFFIKKNKDGCFQLKQRIHNPLFEAFKILFETERKIGIEKDKYLPFSVSSESDVQKVINFFSYSGLHPLIGLKNIQYLKWLADLQNSYRYKNLNFPK